MVSVDSKEDVEYAKEESEGEEEEGKWVKDALALDEK